MLITYPSGLSRLIPYFSSSQTVQTPADRLAVWLVGTMFVTAVSNLLYVGPKTTEIMRLRKHQETRDGKKSYDEGPHSQEMQALNKQFGILHGVSSLVNLVGLGSMVWYGAVLGSRLSI